MKSLALQLIAMLLVSMSWATCADLPRDTPVTSIPELAIPWRANPQKTAWQRTVIKLSDARRSGGALTSSAQAAWGKAKQLIAVAKESQHYEEVIQLLAQVLDSAPWWQDAYALLADAQQSAGQGESAMGTLRFYLQLIEGDSDEAVRAREYIISIQTQIEMDHAREEYRRREADMLCSNGQHQGTTADGSEIVCGRYYYSE